MSSLVPLQPHSSPGLENRLLPPKLAGRHKGSSFGSAINLLCNLGQTAQSVNFYSCNL